MINFMGRAAGKLGTLSKGMAAVCEEEAGEGAPSSSSLLLLPSSSEASPRDNGCASADLISRIQQACSLSLAFDMPHLYAEHAHLRR